MVRKGLTHVPFIHSHFARRNEVYYQSVRVREHLRGFGIADAIQNNFPFKISLRRHAVRLHKQPRVICVVSEFLGNNQQLRRTATQDAANFIGAQTKNFASCPSESASCVE